MYFWVNFINALCYDVNKTIEFRLLRPTYNFKKILLWMYIFNAILKYADEVEDLHAYRDLSLEMLIERVYPADLSKSLILGVKRLRILTENQSRNGDYNGSDISFEDELFPDNLDY